MGEFNESVEQVIRQHTLNPDTAGDVVTAMKGVIERFGLSHPKTMSAAAKLVSKKEVSSHLYRNLVALTKGEAQKPQASTQDEYKQQEVTQETVVQAQVQEAKASNLVTVISVDHLDLTDAQRRTVRERLAKDYEKMKRRLEEKALKVAQRLKDRAERGAIRKGMDPEAAAKYKELKDKKSSISLQVKALQEEVSKLRQEMGSLLPQKVLTPEQQAKKAAREKVRAEKRADREAAKVEKQAAREKVRAEKRALREQRKADRAAARAEAARVAAMRME